MLSQENRMPTHGSLLAVVRYDSRSKSFCHKVLCVFSYRRQSLFHYILPVLLGQMEPAAKIRLCQSLKEIRQVILFLITRNAFLRLFLFNHMTGEPLTNRIKFSEKDIDNLESIISSCSVMYTEDQAVNIILIEEMPAYFLGQKDLDSVIKIIQDRVQKVLDERK